MNTVTNAVSPCWTFDPDVLRRYDRPGPRYTSYPTAPQFHEGFGAADFAQAVARSNLSTRPLSLYVHVPYCTSPCFYCGCNRIISRDRSKGEAYVADVLREADRVAALVAPGRQVTQLHLGGGTPNFLSPALLAQLMAGLRQRFSLVDDAARDYSIELDPRTVTPADIATLAALGFNRASLGVQDFDALVQQAINRVQSVDETLAIVQACRQQGFGSVNIDLIYGLPQQTAAGFAQTLDTVIAVRPDRLAVYGYAHLPHMFKAQRQIVAEQLPTAEQKLELLGLAVTRLAEAGYQYIGLDHFALPREDLSCAQRQGRLHRNFMGYTTHAQSDLIGLGVSAISHVDNTYSQNPRELKQWQSRLDGGLPLWRGMVLSRDDELRASVIQELMCHGRVDVLAQAAQFGVDGRAYFQHEWQALEALVHDGLACVQSGVVSATDKGRPLLRLLAMCFDQYLRQPSETPRYSRAI